MTLSYQYGLASAAALLSASPVEAAAPTKFRVDHTAQCKYLTPNCKGSETTLSATFTDQSGATIYGLTRFEEQAGFVMFDKKPKLGKIGYIHALSEWEAQGGGLKVFMQRQMNVPPNMVFRLGAYAGKIKGTIDWRSRIDLHTDPFTIKFYQWSYDVPGYDRNLWQYRRGNRGETFYGGVTADSGFAYKVSSRMTLIAGQTATAGLDLVEGGLNVGTIISTQAGHSTRTPTGGICQGQPAIPRHGTNFTINACASMRTHDALFEAEKRKAGHADKINHGTAKLAEIVRYRGDVPVYDATRVLKEFGVTTSPYKLRTSIHLSVANDSGLAGGIEIPIGHHYKRDPVFYGSYEYTFK